MSQITGFLRICYQTGKVWCGNLLRNGGNFLTTNRGRWAAGSMFGFSGAASVFLSSSDVPGIFSYGSVLGFLTSTAVYTFENRKDIILYGGPTTMTLLAITIFIFHGLTSWGPVLALFPVFVSTTLLATVNIAPGVTEAFIIFGEGILAIRELRGLNGPQENHPIDLERGQDLLPGSGMAELRGFDNHGDRTFSSVHNYLDAIPEARNGTSHSQSVYLEQARDLLPGPGTTELPGFDYQGYRTIHSIQGYLDGIPDPRNIESPEGTDKSVELENGSQSTTSDIRQVLQKFEPGLIQYTPMNGVGHMDQQSFLFPEAPQDNPLEMQGSESTSIPGNQGLSGELLIPA